MPYHCSEFEKGRIIELKHAGKSVQQIAEHAGRSKKTIRKWLARFEGEGEAGMQQRHKSGRPRTTSAEQDQAMIELAKEQPFMTVREIGTAAGAAELHTSSITSRLKAGGLQTFRSCPTLHLSEANKANRVVFAREMLQQPPEFWEDVVFSDEKIFRTDQTGKLYVRRPKGLRHSEEYSRVTDGSGRVSVQAWAWVDSFGPGELHRIEGRHTAVSYVEILDDVLLPTLEQMRGGRRPHVFIQDNAPQHTALITKDWFRQHQGQVTVLEWAPKSPDLNVIENVWGVMARELGEDGDLRGLTADQLWEKVKGKWDELRSRPTFFKNLAASMPRRLQDVIEAGGAATKY